MPCLHLLLPPSLPFSRATVPMPQVTSLVQPVKRNVIIQRDSRGYGIRISGDNPVSIESVNPGKCANQKTHLHHCKNICFLLDGAAFKAGVRNGDRIIKVNGTLVTKLSHADVVRLIQNCGSYVGLTLLSNPNAGLQSMGNIELSTSPQAHSPTPPMQQLPGGSGAISPNPTTPSTSLMSQHSISGTLNSYQITSPQKAPDSTVQSYQNNQILTLRKMIEAQEGLMKSTISEKEKTDAARVIEELKKKLNGLIAYHNNNNNYNESSNSSIISTTTSSISGSSALGSSTLPVRSTIMTVDSDYEDNVPSYQATIGSDGSSSVLMGSDLLLGGGHSEDDLHLFSSQASKSPPSKISSSFLSKIPGASKRDSKVFNLAAAGGMLASPVMTAFNNSGTMGPVSPNSLSSSSSSSSSNQITIENLPVHSLRFARYLITNTDFAPNPMLFYVITKYIFPRVVAQATSIVVNSHSHSHNHQQRNAGILDTTGLRTLIHRWANQIMATWVCNETPLYFYDFGNLEAFDSKLGSFIATVSAIGPPTAQPVLAANPFETPFLEKSAEIVLRQLKDFQKLVAAKPELLNTTARADLQATVEHLLLGPPGPGGSGAAGLKLDLNQVDFTVDQFISSAQMQDNGKTMVSTMAVISSLLTIGHYVFNIPSKHLLLSDPQNCNALLLHSGSAALLGTAGLLGLASGSPAAAAVNSPLATNPVLKLSSESTSSGKGKHKRMTSLPAQSKPSMNGGGTSAAGSTSGADLLAMAAATGTGISENGHLFVQVNEMTSVIYCSGCQVSLWGDLYNYRCPKCLMFVHLWCIKSTAPLNPCENLEGTATLPSGVMLRPTASTREPSRKKSKLRDNKKLSMIDRIAGKALKRPSAAEMIATSNLNRSTSSLTSSSSSSFGADSISCSSSSDFDEDHSSGLATSNSGALDDEGKSVAGGSMMMTSPVQGGFSAAGGAIAAITGRAPLPVNRSGSFNQRVSSRVIFYTESDFCFLCRKRPKTLAAALRLGSAATRPSHPATSCPPSPAPSPAPLTRPRRPR